MSQDAFFKYWHPLRGPGFCLSVNYATNCGIYVAAERCLAGQMQFARHHTSSLCKRSSVKAYAPTPATDAAVPRRELNPTGPWDMRALSNPAM